jgi:hypothetical protein
MPQEKKPVKKYNYYISYNYSKYEVVNDMVLKVSGYGSTGMTTDTPLNSVKELTDAATHLEKDNGLIKGTVIILFYKELN